MTEDIPFMERPSWMRPDGKPMYKVFCPVAPAEKKKRLSQAANIRRSQGALEDVEEGGRKTQFVRRWNCSLIGPFTR